MDKNIAVMAVLITAWAVTAMAYPHNKNTNEDSIPNVPNLNYDYNNNTIYISTQQMQHFDQNILLHELKHHWCWTNKNEETLELYTFCKKMSNNSYYNNTEWVKCVHQGCFLNTPIDKEYGVIQ